MYILDKKDYISLNTITENLLSSSGIAHSAASYIMKNEALTVKGLAKIKTVTSTLSSMIRSIMLINDFIENDKINEPSEKNFYCNIDKFFDAFIAELNSTFASGAEIKFIYISKLSENRTFFVNMAKLEKILYSLIYCLIKNLKDCHKKEIKIAIKETHTKENGYIITITSTGKALRTGLTAIFDAKNTSEIDFCDIDTLNLLSACKTVETLKANVVYSATKTLNKFVLTIPHITSFDVEKQLEVKEYIPDTNIISAYFGDLII